MAARMRIRILTHVHGELALDSGRHVYAYAPGTHEAWTETEAAIFAHLIGIGVAKPAARRKRAKKEA
jgi:hypothetical protein